MAVVCVWIVDKRVIIPVCSCVCYRKIVDITAVRRFFLV